MIAMDVPVITRNLPIESWDRTDLYRRIALVRFLLALANFGVIWVDSRGPDAESGTGSRIVIVAASLFLVYAGCCLAYIRATNRATLIYEVSTPLLDVMLSGVLIAVTDGYLSPFNLWLVFAVVACSISRLRWVPWLAVLVAFLAHLVIAQIPQSAPLDIAVFTVRTGYLFGFCAVLTAISSRLSSLAERLARVNQFGRELSEAKSVADVVETMGTVLEDTIKPDGLAVFVDGSTLLVVGERGTQEETFPMLAGSHHDGELRLSRRTPLSSDDRSLVNIVWDRTSASLRRLWLADELAQAAAREERLRMADHLHDAHLQVLSGISMQAQVALEAAHRDGKDVSSNIREIQFAAREGLKAARRFVDAQYTSQVSGGPASVRSLFELRWKGEWSVDMDPGLRLTEGQWRGLEAFVVEGLNNARSHGKATVVRLSSREADGAVCFELLSDGRSPIDQPRFGYGLTRLANIVEPNGGSVRLESGKGGGAKLVLTFEANDDTHTPD